jgi:flagellar protein FlaI
LAFKWFGKNKGDKENSVQKVEDIRLSDLLNRTSGEAYGKETQGFGPDNSEGITEPEDYGLPESTEEGEKAGVPEGAENPEMFEFQNLSDSAVSDDSGQTAPSPSPSAAGPVWPVISRRSEGSAVSSGGPAGLDNEGSAVSSGGPAGLDNEGSAVSSGSPAGADNIDSDVSSGSPEISLSSEIPENDAEVSSGFSAVSSADSPSPKHLSVSPETSEPSPEPPVDASGASGDAGPVITAGDDTSPETPLETLSVSPETSGNGDGLLDDADEAPAEEPEGISSETRSEEITPVIRDENPAEAAVFIPGGSTAPVIPESEPEDPGMEAGNDKRKKKSSGGLFGRKKGLNKKESRLNTLNGEKPVKKGFLSGFNVKKREPVRFYNPETDEPLLDAKIPDGYEEVESYWIEEGATKVIIGKNVVSGLNEYLLFEPALTEFEHELAERLYEDMRDVLILTDEDLLKDRKEVLMEKMADLLKEYHVSLEDNSLFKLQYYLIRNFLGWSKLEPLIKDPNIEDISCDGADIPIFLYHRRYHNVKTNLKFEEEMLYSLAITLAQRSGKHISVSQPMLDATMPDGSRLQLTLGKEVTSRGTSFTIRKFREEPFTPVELIELNTFSIDELVYFWLAIENNKSLLFVGGTASGKTTSLNAVSLFIPPIAKVVSIEDTREITLFHDNWIASVTRESVSESNASKIDMFDLLKAAMRQRPEYILVGEVRGMEAQTLFQAMNTGHTTFSTLHANNVDAAIHRLENPPLNVPRNMVQALDIVSIQSLIYRGQDRVRRSMEIVEIIGIDPSTGSMRVNTVFEYDPISDRHSYKGRSQVYSNIMEVRGWSNQEMSEEVEKRMKILDAMHDQGMRDYISFTRVVQSYAINPGKVLENLDDLKKALI